MNDDEAQAIWRDYYQRIRNRRISEAEQLVAAARLDGITDRTKLFLEFRHFSSVEADIHQLRNQLVESYDVVVAKDESTGSWILNGTTRPVEMEFDLDQLIKWVEFMADVAQSYGCVFSTWVLTQVKTGRQWESEAFESLVD